MQTETKQTNHTGETRYFVEFTDTYGGEANYSWVHRHNFTAPASLSNVALVRRAKKLLGLSGIRCRVSNYGDMIELRPANSATVAFITW